MEKLQWFKFSISEWKMGKIQRCNAETKSMFLELCCLYWINETKVSIEDAIIECDKEHYDILISKRIIKEVDGFIKIYFLDEQFESAMEKSVKARESVEKRWAKRKEKELPTNNERNTNVIQPNNERNTEENRREENRKEDYLSTEVEDKKKQTFEEQVKAFLVWFNEMMLKRKGKLGRFNKLSKPDRNNFKEVRASYEFKDFEIAFNNMYKNQWVHETGNLTPTHFLRLDNFNRYLNQSSTYTPASKILDHD